MSFKKGDQVFLYQNNARKDETWQGEVVSIDPVGIYLKYDSRGYENLCLFPWTSVLYLHKRTGEAPQDE